MNIQKVGVLGCGLMGSGIAQVAAMSGFDVTVLEVEQKYLDKGFAGIQKSLAKFAERPPEKGGITPQQKDAALARLHGALEYGPLLLRGEGVALAYRAHQHEPMDPVAQERRLHALRGGEIDLEVGGELGGRGREHPGPGAVEMGWHR